MDDPLSNLSAEQECRGKRVLDASRYLAMPSGASVAHHLVQHPLCLREVAAPLERNGTSRSAQQHSTNISRRARQVSGPCVRGVALIKSSQLPVDATDAQARRERVRRLKRSVAHAGHAIQRIQRLVEAQLAFPLLARGAR